MQPVNLNDYEALAQTQMERPIWDYYQGGSGDEITLRENRRVFDRLWLRPRVLVNVDSIDASTSILGTPVSMPILVAQGPLWFQLYYYTRKEAQGLIERAQASGYRAIVLTVDAPLLGKRERDIRNNFGGYQRTNHPLAFSGNAPHLSAKRLEAGEPYEGKTLTWETLAWLRSITPLPILVKGILTAEDALLALEYGASGIIVSNHGGRQLDSAIPSLAALPEIAEFELAMLLSGCPTLADIQPALVRRADV